MIKIIYFNIISTKSSFSIVVPPCHHSFLSRFFTLAALPNYILYYTGQISSVLFSGSVVGDCGCTHLAGWLLLPLIIGTLVDIFTLIHYLCRVYRAIHHACSHQFFPMVMNLFIYQLPNSSIIYLYKLYNILYSFLLTL